MLSSFFLIFLQLVRGMQQSSTVIPSIESEKMLLKIREMFDFGYTNYMKFAYPEDELDPIHCCGRGPDLSDRNNINVNDALGDYQLTLVDSLDSLAVFGNTTEFKRAVKLVAATMSFNKQSVVQVFEANIRILGGLLSAHLLITDPHGRFGDLRPDNYNDELLRLAQNLCDRLLIAFKGTPTGIPFPRIHLGWRSVETLGRVDTCLAGAGTLLLEMGTLSLLLQDSRYATLARNTVRRLWNYRSRKTGLLGTDINIYTGEWINSMSGVGAGQDSFYEYLLKAGILFDDSELIKMFEESLRNLRYGLCEASPVHRCACPEGYPSVYWNIDMFTGEVINTWVDTLQSVWPGILTLAGELRDAKRQHELHLSIWQHFGLPPERFNLVLNRSELSFYPLRPEFAESTYYLYRATKNPLYLRIGSMIISNLDRYTRAKCGFATIHDVEDMTQEDRMESFFLSETLKYLYLLFDESHPLNVHEEDYLFTTQGHILPISRLRKLALDLPNSPFVNARFANHSPSVGQVRL
ncbi:unnamed protein product [Hydatigera taeniaeformis]|uniref:alpha-1,2-Mannosidase n=1 Tax=Hydatigena taeniaeformis TaxID=6205 RepID=A0A0R3X0U9_HYDTA|nr:unnamed protein product [Hydatigera taeniaeformis]